MNQRILKGILLLLVISVCLSGCSKEVATASNAELVEQAQCAINEFVIMADDIKGNQISLTIYCLPFNIFTRGPIRTLDELIADSLTQKITVTPEELLLSPQIMQELDMVNLQPINTYPYVDIRVGYIIKVGETHEILKIAINSGSKTNFVNGVEVEYNDVFFEIADLFLPEDFEMQFDSAHSIS